VNDVTIESFSERCYLYHFKNISLCFTPLAVILLHPKVIVTLLGLYIRTTSSVCLLSSNRREREPEILLRGRK
jgi:hypothetical protein